MEISRTGILIRTITANINQYISKKLTSLGIGYGQFDYFLFISLNEGINQNELARLKNVGKASVTKAIRILEKEGLIERMVDESDKRNFKLYCTKEGKRYIEQLKELKKEIEMKVFKGFTEEEKENLNSMLERMLENTKDF